MKKSNTWPVQDAKARFSEFLDACVSDGPQVVTRRGAETAVLVSLEQWRQLCASAKPDIKEVLLGEGPRFDLPLPKRSDFKLRPFPTFD